MFSVNDKIVYPMHGAGIIEKIEEKEVLGEVKKYYIMTAPNQNMQVMIPVEKSSVIGIREIVSKEEAAKVMDCLGSESTPMPDNWNRRYRENVEKLKTGDIYAVAEVVRNLTRVDKIKKLSAGEKKLLNNAKQILVSELALSFDKSDEDIYAEIMGKINIV